MRSQHNRPARLCRRVHSGLLRCIDGELESVQTLLVEDGLIRRIYTLRNPDKLSGVPVPPQALP